MTEEEEAGVLLALDEVDAGQVHPARRSDAGAPCAPRMNDVVFGLAPEETLRRCTHSSPPDNPQAADRVLDDLVSISDSSRWDSSAAHKSSSEVEQARLNGGVKAAILGSTSGERGIGPRSCGCIAGASPDRRVIRPCPQPPSHGRTWCAVDAGNRPGWPPPGGAHPGRKRSPTGRAVEHAAQVEQVEQPGQVAPVVRQVAAGIAIAVDEPPQVDRVAARPPDAGRSPGRRGASRRRRTPSPGRRPRPTRRPLGTGRAGSTACSRREPAHGRRGARPGSMRVRQPGDQAAASSVDRGERRRHARPGTSPRKPPSTAPPIWSGCAISRSGPRKPAPWKLKRWIAARTEPAAYAACSMATAAPDVSRSSSLTPSIQVVTVYGGSASAST